MNTKILLRAELVARLGIQEPTLNPVREASSKLGTDKTGKEMGWQYEHVSARDTRMVGREKWVESAVLRIIALCS